MTSASTELSIATSEAPTTRSEWMDVLRGATMLLVISFHSASLLRLIGLPTPAWLAAVNSVLLPVGMPLLMFLSGLLVRIGLRRDRRTFFQGIFARLVWPFAVWTVIYAALTGGLSPAGMLTYATGGSYLYFLAFLAVYYACAWPLRHVSTGPIIAATILLAALADIFQLAAHVPHRFVVELPYLAAFFALGSAASHWKPTVWNHPALYLLTIPPAIWVAWYSTTEAVAYDWRWAWAIASGVIVLARLAQLWTRHMPTRLLVYVGRHSIVFYVIHFPVIVATMRGLNEVGPESAWTAIGVSLAAALTVDFAASWARTRWRVVNALFTLPA